MSIYALLIDIVILCNMTQICAAVFHYCLGLKLEKNANLLWSLCSDIMDLCLRIYGCKISV